MIAFNADAFGQSFALKNLPHYYRVIIFLIALSLFPGTAKGEFDYVCIVVSFKSSIVLKCAKNGLRETHSQTAEEDEQQRRAEEGTQYDTHRYYYDIYFMFSKANRDISQPNYPFNNSFSCNVTTRLGVEERCL